MHANTIVNRSRLLGFVREATWLVLSYRPDALAYYHFDAGETLEAVGEVRRRLVEPYGHTLREKG